MKKFFIGCNLNFEDELALEIQEIWPFLLGLDGKPHAEPLNILSIEPGGVTIENSWHLGLQLNFFSKLSNRILVRVSEFKVRDFPKLFQKLKQLKSDALLMDPYFKAGWQFEVAASQSRLNNEKRILEILRELFKEAPEAEADSELASSISTLFVRMRDDLCSISVDTSGTLLHKRSERLKAGPAPLRETLAAFCARKLIEGMHFSELEKISLIDPMAGTGTLLLEAAQLYQLSPRDEFPFKNWKQSPKLLCSPSIRSGYGKAPLLFEKVIAMDIDENVLNLAQDRLKVSGLNYFSQVQNLFDGTFDFSSQGQERMVILNPPYGERLKADFSPTQLVEKIFTNFSPLRLGILFSENQVKSLGSKLQKGQNGVTLWSGQPYSLLSQNAFKNGGLPVQFLVFKRA